MKKFNIKFYENRKIYFGITIALFAIGIIFNIIFGTTLDIRFKGGAMLDYTYTGEISTSDVESIVEDVTGQNVDIRVYSSMVDTNGANTNGIHHRGSAGCHFLRDSGEISRQRADG